MHVEPVSQTGAAGAVAIVVAVVGRVKAPAVNVVEVAVMFQPAAAPVASETSNAWAAVTVLLRPFNAVEGNVTFAGGVTKPNVPAVNVTDAVLAPAGPAAASKPATTKATSVNDIRSLSIEQSLFEFRYSLIHQRRSPLIRSSNSSSHPLSDLRPVSFSDRHRRPAP